MTNQILQSLDKLPQSSDVYLWCDYVELRCLVHPDKKFSRQNLIEVIDDSKAAGIRATAAADDVADDEAELDTEEEDSEFEAEDEAEATPLPASDKSEARAADLFGSLELRSALFAESYPFEIIGSGHELQLRPVAELGATQLLYLQLLLSSSLRFVPKNRRKELTDPFEFLSTQIFKGLMPSGWEVHQFGAQTGSRYRGHLATRMDALAADWRAKHLLERGQYSTRNAGDGGLDIVAWHPMGNDDRGGIPLAAAQCGCTATDWQLKQLEASPANLRNKIAAIHPWSTYYFMPHDLVRLYNGKNDWQRRDWLGESIVVDRLRIVRLAQEFGVHTDYSTPSTAVEEATAMAIT